MKYFPVSLVKTGIEISAEQIIMTQIIKKGNLCSIQHLSNVTFAPGVIKPLFKKKNILNEKAFVNNMKKSLKGIRSKLIGVALPDACFKVFIKKFKEVPEKKHEINDMVMWSISESLSIPVEELRVSWDYMGKNKKKYYVFLIVLGMKTILEQYGQVLKKSGVLSVMFAPAGLNRFNFYAEKVPEIGNNVYLSLFDDSLTAFVFSNGIPIFYKVVKKGLISNKRSSAIEEMYILLQYFHIEYPDFIIDKFFIASNIKSDFQMGQLLKGSNPVEFTIINEDKLVYFDKIFKPRSEHRSLSFYSSALGTAQSI
ncbi:MAG: hypothetical protein KAR45_16130 [Desulfobacteraceae bacterium]|nr:hypothetical protein [Desulfobacteraceae bacterium]